MYFFSSSALSPGGGRLGLKHARMCASKSEGIKGMK